MPRLPKLLADWGEKMGVPCSVTATEFLDRDLKRVRFEGNFRKIAFIPGQVTEFRVSANDFRHYTPSFFDADNGICDVLFYLHGKGPGSEWASNLCVGKTTRLLGFGGRMKLSAVNKYHFFFGDETSIGLFHCLKAAIHQNGDEYLGLLELNEEAALWPQKVDLWVDTVLRSPDHEPAAQAIAYLNDLDARVWNTWKNAVFYLAGRAASIQTFRKELLVKGVYSNQIRALPYWADGKRGL